MECLNSGLDILLKSSIQTSVVNSHTVTYEPADNPAHLKFNCPSYSVFYIDSNSVILLSRLKLVKTGGSYLPSDGSITAACVNNLLHSMYIFLSVSLNRMPVTTRHKLHLHGVPRRSF